MAKHGILAGLFHGPGYTWIKLLKISRHPAWIFLIAEHAEHSQNGAIDIFCLPQWIIPQIKPKDRPALCAAALLRCAQGQTSKDFQLRSFQEFLHHGLKG